MDEKRDDIIYELNHNGEANYGKYKLVDTPDKVKVYFHGICIREFKFWDEAADFVLEA